MPLVGITPSFLEVYKNTHRSAVALRGFSNGAQVGCGFIVHKSPNVTVVAMDSRCAAAGADGISVCFADDTCSPFSGDKQHLDCAGVYGVDLVFARIPKGDWDEVQYGEIHQEGELLLTSAPHLVHGPNNVGIRNRRFTGYVISRCPAVSHEAIPRSNEEFAFHLPIKTRGSDIVLGAPVYNMENRFIGFANKLDNNFDTKLGLRAECFQRALNCWKGNRSWNDIIEQYAGPAKKAM